jgi:hypothetical protein
VLDPAVAGILLLEFHLRLGTDGTVGIEYDCPRAGGTLIDGE